MPFKKFEKQFLNDYYLISELSHRKEWHAEKVGELGQFSLLRNPNSFLPLRRLS